MSRYTPPKSRRHSYETLQAYIDYLLDLDRRNRAEFDKCDAALMLARAEIEQLRAQLAEVQK